MKQYIVKQSKYVVVGFVHGQEGGIDSKEEGILGLYAGEVDRCDSRVDFDLDREDADRLLCKVEGYRETVGSWEILAYHAHCRVIARYDSHLQNLLAEVCARKGGIAEVAGEKIQLEVDIDDSIEVGISCHIHCHLVRHQHRAGISGVGGSPIASVVWLDVTI